MDESAPSHIMLECTRLLALGDYVHSGLSTLNARNRAKVFHMLEIFLPMNDIPNLAQHFSFLKCASLLITHKSLFTLRNGTLIKCFACRYANSYFTVFWIMLPYSTFMSNYGSQNVEIRKLRHSSELTFVTNWR